MTGTSVEAGLNSSTEASMDWHPKGREDEPDTYVNEDKARAEARAAKPDMNQALWLEAHAAQSAARAEALDAAGDTQQAIQVRLGATSLGDRPEWARDRGARAADRAGWKYDNPKEARVQQVSLNRDLLANAARPRM